MQLGLRIMSEHIAVEMCSKSLPAVRVVGNMHPVCLCGLSGPNNTSLARAAAAAGSERAGHWSRVT